uniref:TetR/AcrR family transcriptional regulator n=1 Tax=Nocardia araoensis TaxID=228600 RepID=UPI0005844C9C
MTHDPRAALWSRGDSPKPGPRPGYTLEQLADACIRLADQDGLRAVSMRRVAGNLGTAAASLYRYVDGKDDLITLMVDRVAAEYEYPPLTGDVRTDVLALAEQSRALHRQHGWLIHAQPTSLGPHTMR